MLQKLSTMLEAIMLLWASVLLKLSIEIFFHLCCRVGYSPVNTAYEVNDAYRWQPDIQVKGLGLYKVRVQTSFLWRILLKRRK